MTGILVLPQEPRLIGPALADLRKVLGYKQVDVVNAGVGNQGVVSAFENGHTMPLPGTIIAYLAFLGYQLAAVPLPETEGT